MRVNRDISNVSAPRAEDIEWARKIVETLGGKAAADIHVRIDEVQGNSMPEYAVAALLEIISHLAAGNAVSVMDSQQQLSTQEAADLLGVSRPFLVARIDAGEIPSQMVGTHRRIVLRDLMEYKKKTDAGRRAALKQIAAEGQRLGLDL